MLLKVKFKEWYIFFPPVFEIMCTGMCILYIYSIFGGTAPDKIKKLFDIYYIFFFKNILLYLFN